MGPVSLLHRLDLWELGQSTIVKPGLARQGFALKQLLRVVGGNRRYPKPPPFAPHGPHAPFPFSLSCFVFKERGRVRLEPGSQKKQCPASKRGSFLLALGSSPSAPKQSSKVREKRSRSGMPGQSCFWRKEHFRLKSFSHLLQWLQAPVPSPSRPKKWKEGTKPPQQALLPSGRTWK